MTYIYPGRNPKFTVGQTIIILAGWVERGVVNPDKMGKDSPGNTLGGIMPAPDLGQLSKGRFIIIPLAKMVGGADISTDRHRE